LQILNDKKVAVQEVLYLENPPSEKELKAILKKLGVSAEDIVRKGEDIFKEQFKGKTFSEDEWVQILAKNPKLIERPIVFDDKKAVVGRPPENVLKMI
jgi:arsenate reductase (glutaredoxin)